MGVFVPGYALDLNMSARGCGGSSTSLPGTPAGEHGPANSVMSWAVSFEKLLEDPFGVRYFTVRQTNVGIFQLGKSSGRVQVLTLTNHYPYLIMLCMCLSAGLLKV